MIMTYLYDRRPRLWSLRSSSMPKALLKLRAFIRHWFEVLVGEVGLLPHLHHEDIVHCKPQTVSSKHRKQSTSKTLNPWNHATQIIKENHGCGDRATCVYIYSFNHWSTPEMTSMSDTLLLLMSIALSMKLGTCLRLQNNYPKYLKTEQNQPAFESLGKWTLAEVCAKKVDDIQQLNSWATHLQVGVKAPGTARRTTFLPFRDSWI